MTVGTHGGDPSLPGPNDPTRPAEPDPTTPPAGGQPAASRTRKVLRMVPWLALTMILASVAVSLIPIDNPGVQRCGSPAQFLLDGTVDTRVDANDQVPVADGTRRTLTPEQADRARNSPCSQLVADRMVPVAVVFAIGLVLALVSLVATLVSLWRDAPHPPPRHDPTVAPVDPPEPNLHPDEASSTPSPSS